MRLHIGAQHLIDSGLVPLAGVPEVLEHVGIEAQRDLLLVLGRERNAGARPLGIDGAGRDIAEVDVLRPSWPPGELWFPRSSWAGWPDRG